MLTTILFAVLPVLGLLVLPAFLLVAMAVLVGGGSAPPRSAMVERAAARNRFIAIRRLDEHQGAESEFAV